MDGEVRDEAEEAPGGESPERLTDAGNRRPLYPVCTCVRVFPRVGVIAKGEANPDWKAFVLRARCFKTSAQGIVGESRPEKKDYIKVQRRRRIGEYGSGVCVFGATRSPGGRQQSTGK